MLHLKTKHLILICGFLFSFLAKGQNLIKVQDPALAVVLCEQMSGLMNATCDSLDLDKISAVPEADIQTFDGNNRGITNADELKYITGLDTIFIRDNDLTEFPDLNNFNSVVRVDLTNNNLTVAPRINYPNNGSLRIIQVTGNKVRSFPSWGDTINNTITFANISWNRMKVLPVLDSLTQMNNLRVHRNELPFSELLKIKQLSTYEMYKDRWTIFPQHNFFVSNDTSIFFDDELNIQVEDQTAGNNYYLLSSNDTIARNTTGEFLINLELIGEFAELKFVITNDGFSEGDAFLQSNTFEVDIKYPSPYNDEGYLKFSPDGNGIDDFLYLDGVGDFTIHGANGELVQKGDLPINWEGKKTDGSYINPGIYYLRNSSGLVKILALY